MNDTKTREPIQGFNEFFDAYKECALWASHRDDDGDEFNFDGLTIYDFSEQSEQILRAHALSYYSQVHYYLNRDEDATPHAGSPAAQLGHDFWLDQNGYGTGATAGHWPRYGTVYEEVAEGYPSLYPVRMGGEVTI